MKGTVPSGRSPTNSVLVADGSNGGPSHRFAGPQHNGVHPFHPAYFGVLLERRWAEGITKVRHLFAEIRHRGYTGPFSYLARFLAPWRSGEPSLEGDEQEEPAPVRVPTLDPMTGRVVSPLTAAALCIKPRGQMTARQVATSMR